jgi:LysR family hydrogen peroxide-inducible transcriptional activator
MISLRQLRYFEALARTRHFGQAARLCAVSQPALSMQVKELESILGVALVERRAGAVALTRAGAEVAARAEAILAQVRDLGDFARAQGGVLAGPLRLGLIPSVAPYLLPGLLRAAARRHPDLDLSIRESQTAALLDELRRGELDAVVAALPLEGEVEALALFDDPFLVAVEASRAEGWAGEPDPRARLARERLLLLEEGHCLRDQAIRYCGLPEPETRRALAAASLATIMSMVAAGHGVTLLPTLCASEAARPGIALVPFPDAPPRRTIGLAWRRSSARERDFLALAELLHTEPASV